MKTITIVRILSRITLLAAAGILLGLLYKSDANAATISVSVEPRESGSVSVNVEAPNTLDNIAPETSVNLVATPANGYVFSHWGINNAELENDEEYSSTPATFIMPPSGEDVTVTAYFQPAPAPDPSQTSEPPADPPKDEIEELMKRTSNSVGGVPSQVDQINIATVLSGFSVSTPKADLVKDYLLEEGEDILVKVSNFDAAKSPDCKKAMDTFAQIEGLGLGPAINFEIGMVDSDKKYFAFDDSDCTVAVKIGLKNFPNAFGVLEITGTGVRILGDQDYDPDTVTVNASCRNSTLVVIKSSYQITAEYLETLQKELIKRLADLSSEEKKLEETGNGIIRRSTEV